MTRSCIDYTIDMGTIYTDVFNKRTDLPHNLTLSVFSPSLTHSCATPNTLDRGSGCGQTAPRLPVTSFAQAVSSNRLLHAVHRDFY